MTIIIDYYVWFLISGVVLLLITIGYLAEQTNFGKKRFGEKMPEPTNDGSVTLETSMITNDFRINDINNNINRVDDIQQPINESDNVIDDFTIIPEQHNIEYSIEEINDIKEENDNLSFNRNYNLSNNDINFDEIRQINNETNQNDDIWKF